jgi:hypothetical protein
MDADWEVVSHILPKDSVTLTPSRKRPTREVFKQLISQLDRELPTGFRSARCANGAGGRSLGLSGRSVHDVLSDVTRAVAARRLEVESRKVLRSRGRVAFEIGMPGWIIIATSPGAEAFFQNAPWGSMMGRSLADLVIPEDLDDLDALTSCSAQVPCASSIEKAETLSLAGFVKAEDLNDLDALTSCSAQVPCASSNERKAKTRLIRLLNFKTPDLREGPEPWQRAVRRHTAQVSNVFPHLDHRSAYEQHIPLTLPPHGVH